MKRKGIIIILGAAVFAGIVFLFLSQKREQAPSPPPPRPQIPTFVSGTLPITLKLTEKDFNIPGQASTLSYLLEIITLEKAKEIAQSLGFATEVTEFDDLNEGKKYYWTTDREFLIITPTTGKVKYGINATEVPSVGNKNLSDNEISNIAEVFLESFLSETDLKNTLISPLRKNSFSEGFSQTTKSNAELFQANFTYDISDFEILTIDPSFPLMFARILPDGSVYSAEAVLFTSLAASQAKFTLKNFTDFSNSLSEASLITLTNDYLNISDLTIQDIKSIEIDEVTLVYLLDQYSSKILQPVFLLEGDVSVIGSSANRAILYMPATK